MPIFVDRLKREVRDYHASHRELHQAHHFDFAIEHDAQIDHFCFGINPGETPEDKALFPGNGHFNPYDPATNPLATGKWSKSAKRYRNYASNICGGHRFLISEFFFWSSKDEKELESRYGPRPDSPHWRFCFNQNKKLFDHYNPKAVIVVGLGLVKSVMALNRDLRHVPQKSALSRRLFEHYTDGERPWIFVIHPSARVSVPQRDRIANYVKSVSP